MGYLSFEEISAAFSCLDDPDALESSKADPALAAALQWCRPRNWWGTGVGEALLTAAQEEGLPLAWVPRPAIIKELAEAEGAMGRLNILVAHRPDITTDCLDVLHECTDREIAGDVELARQAVEAVVHGFDAPGMALAVCLGERLAAWAATPRVRAFESKDHWDQWQKKLASIRSPYKRYAFEMESNLEGEAHTPTNFIRRALIAPIPRFFTPWHPRDEVPPPTHVSRHVVAHQAALEHFSPSNALLSIMLVTSILREQQDWIEEVGPEVSEW